MLFDDDKASFSYLEQNAQIAEGNRTIATKLNGHNHLLQNKLYIYICI